MSIYHINPQLTAMGDIQRQYGFKVVIEPPVGIGSASAFGETGIIFSQVREVTIPGRTNQPIDSFFVGMKQKFPGKEEFDGNFTVNIEESGNLDGLKAIYEWKQKIFNVTQGVSNTLVKKDIMGSANVFFLDYAERQKPQYIRVQHIWPIGMPDISLAYSSGGDSVKFPITFAYDFWTMENADNNYSTGGTYL
jgi:hypothetical protein